MQKKGSSRSDEQRFLESRVMNWLEQMFEGVALEANRTLPLSHNPDACICPDFYSEQDRIIGEIFAHLGPVKKGQRDKLAADVLKLILYESDCGRGFDKYIVVCDAGIRDYLMGKSYLAAAIRQFDVKVLLYRPSEEEVSFIIGAQRRQDFYPGHAQANGIEDKSC